MNIISIIWCKKVMSMSSTKMKTNTWKMNKFVWLLHQLLLLMPCQLKVDIQEINTCSGIHLAGAAIFWKSTVQSAE